MADDTDENLNGQEEDEREEEEGEEAVDAQPLLPPIPEELGIDPLLLALLHTAAFLDLSDDESVDPELAGDVLEHVGMYAQRLPPERVQELEQQLEKLQAHAEQSGWPPELSEFVGQFLYNCGIGDEDD
jgi:hypothetical protein